MNKKILFFILFLLIVISPIITLAADPAPVGGVPPIVTKIEGMFVSIGASIVIIGWVIAGILYLTAAGSPEKVGTAKKAMVACVIGTALVVLAGSAKTILEFYLK